MRKFSVIKYLAPRTSSTTQFEGFRSSAMKRTCFFVQYREFSRQEKKKNSCWRERSH